MAFCTLWDLLLWRGVGSKPQIRATAAWDHALETPIRGPASSASRGASIPGADLIADQQRMNCSISAKVPPTPGEKLTVRGRSGVDALAPMGYGVND